MSLASDYLKFQTPGNRYAYFPSTKAWKGQTGHLSSLKELDFEINGNNGHLYIHLPFCRSLCTFCGCNIKISSHKEDHLEYISALEKEIKLKTVEDFSLTSLTIGGGSPNALHPQALDRLGQLLSSFSWKDSLCEIDPTILDQTQMNQLKGLGIGRFSIGVQDFDQEICRNVNRHQRLDDLYRAKDLFQGMPFGIDLIFGFPKQKLSHIEAWAQPIRELGPDWISLYPLAPVPWLAPYQEAYGEFEVPSTELKANIYEAAHHILLDSGYQHFGFGHYINQKGHLTESFEKKHLFRSVSGLYKEKHDFTLSLGVGGISEFSNGLHQNDRILEKYKVGLLTKDSISSERHHYYTSIEKEFLLLSRQVIETKELDQQTFKLLFPEGYKNHPKINHAWFDEKANGQFLINNTGVLFLKNILQVLEQRYFGLE